MSVTSIVGAAPEVSAPVRREGQSNSEVLFNWLTVKRNLWMLEERYSFRLELLIGLWGVIRLSYRLNKWRRGKEEINSHPAFQIPGDEADIERAFEQLARLLEAHFFGVEESPSVT